jgi:hypothetical protein
MQSFALLHSRGGCTIATEEATFAHEVDSGRDPPNLNGPRPWDLHALDVYLPGGIYGIR